MIPSDFIYIDSRRFYREVWPRIKDRVEAIDSNLEYAARRLSWAPQPALMVYWGEIDKTTGKHTLWAISRSSGKTPDEHWAAADLLKN